MSAAIPAQSRRGPGLVRRNTATSCCSTSNSTSFDAGERPSKTSQPQTRMKMRYSRRRDTTDHHGAPLTPVHRCSSQARQTSGTSQASGAFLAEARNVVLLAPPGTGQHCACLS
jgi:hypothetical protein